MELNRLFKIGINETIIDKPPVGSPVNHAVNWQNKELTTDEFISHVKCGHAFSAHFRENYRNTQNFICSDVIAADVDGTMTLEEALGSSFIKDNATFIYTTPRHNEEEHRFRVVFLLEQTISRSGDWRDALLGLAHKLGSDKSIKDAARLLYGNTKATVYFIGKSLSQEETKNLISVGVDHRSRVDRNLNSPFSMISSMNLSPETRITLATGQVLPLKNIEPKLSVYCPFHPDKNPSAFVIRSLYAASIGIHCMACNVSYWAGRSVDYDFDAFDRLIEERTTIDRIRIREHQDTATFLEQYFPPDPSINIRQQKYLGDLSYRPGITMVKSPKGSGKTESLRLLLEQIRTKTFRIDLDKKDYPKSILLVGHRQSLIREAAAKLGLPCYLDNPDHFERKKGFATCLDSLHKVTTKHNSFYSDGGYLSTEVVKYDVLILDESEQIFSHLTADTLSKNNGTQKAYDALEKVIREAKSIYALDADLGLITAHTLKEMRPNDWKDRCHIIFNKPVAIERRRKLYLFRRKTDINNKLSDAISQGKRCFITSNSKDTINTLEQLILKKFDGKILYKKITSDNSRNPEERDFVQNIVSEYEKIQVLLCSPPLGTGIDISFPNGEQKVDHIFGYFYPCVNTHTDIDQQLSRVRNPGEVSVWFRASNFNYETNFEVIKNELAQGYWVQAAIKGKNELGEVLFDDNHPLLLVWSHVICSQRSSKNELLRHFEKLRAQNGWDLETLETWKQPGLQSDSWKEAQKSVKEKKIAGILAAEDLPDEDIIDLHNIWTSGEKFTSAQGFQLKRGMLRMTFNTEVTEDLVRLSLDGQLQKRISNFKVLCLMIDQEYPSSYTEALVRKSSPEKIGRMSVGNLVLVLMDVCGFIRAGKIDPEIELNLVSLERFRKVCVKNQIVIEEIIKSNFRDDFDKNPVRQLNVFLGLVGLAVKKVSRKRSSSKQSRFYALDISRLKKMCAFARTYTDFEEIKKYKKECPTDEWGCSRGRRIMGTLDDLMNIFKKEQPES